MKIPSTTQLQLLVSLVSFLGPPAVYSCSCPFPLPTRSSTILNHFCSVSQRVYVGTVIGATCNCIPVGGERTSTYCQNYQLQEGTAVTNVEVVGRGECSNDRVTFPLEYLRNCTALGTSAGVVPSGFTVEGPSDSNLPPVTNTTRPFDDCGLSCSFNLNVSNDDAYYEYLPCFYQVRIKEVLKGDITEGEVLSVVGPDVLTTCGYPGLLLQINQSYVVGIGGACSPIGEWSPVDTYTMQELEWLRELRDQNEAGTLTACDESTTIDGGTDSTTVDSGSFRLLPSVMLTLIIVLLFTLTPAV